MAKKVEVFKSTPEQYQIEHYQGKKLIIKAFAGTGKTSVLVKYALNNPRDRMLYLAYNRAIRDEAKSKFPSNVECKTSHQIAYAAFGRNYRHKLTANLRLMDIANVLGVRDWTLARNVQETLNAFMSSADKEVLEEHFNTEDSKRMKTDRELRYAQTVVEAAKEVWGFMTDKEHALPLTHDAYLKMYQLSDPDLSAQYEVVLFDEAQDANPVTSDFVLKQKTRLLLAGDSHQQIYGFRGANDALNSRHLDDADRLFLTNSFRFGPNVALIANMLLKIKGESMSVAGLGGADSVLDKLPEAVSHYALICRTVAGVVDGAINAVFEGKKVFWVGGMDSYSLKELLDLYHFSEKEYDQVSNKRMMIDYQSFDEFQEVADATKDFEMMRSVRLLSKYKNIPKLIGLLKSQEVHNQDLADVTVTTAHRAKGLEFKTVMLADDFPDIFDKDMEPSQKDDEVNLLYVAVTRAMKQLTPNDIVLAVVRDALIKRKLVKTERN